ncbi:hypothetical protein Tco_1354440 [Tanacetum coccineum]
MSCNLFPFIIDLAISTTLRFVRFATPFCCPPHCQLCRTNGHYASSCPSLHTYASNAATSDANLAQAFTSQCHVTQGHPDYDQSSYLQLERILIH